VLIALPFIRQSGHSDHEAIRFVPIGAGSFCITTPRVDARAKRGGKSSRTNAFTGVASFEIAPLVLDGERLIPGIQPEPTLALQAQRI
jgi:hypothetical protein